MGATLRRFVFPGAAQIMPSLPPDVEWISDIPRLAPRSVDANKGTFGRALVIAGSRGMSGAAILSASSALRGGAGLVRLAVPHELLPIVAAANPCYLTTPMPQDEEGRFGADAEAELLDLVRAADVTAVGPGLSRSAGLTTLVSAILAKTDRPLVLDADGLNAVDGASQSLTKRAGPLVLTPHPGEFARLIGSTIPHVQAHREELAVEFAARHQLVLLLKGHQTIVTDGRRLYRNTTGNPGMATGGTGDVLTGLIAALIGQKLSPFDAARLGAHWHGSAGDLARDELGEVSLIASDLLDYLPRVTRA
jgi:NAD(P)H-hydrate epimerase